jgi:hypothetical protein
MGRLAPKIWVTFSSPTFPQETGRRAGVDVYALPTGIHTKKELSQARPRSILRHLDELIPLAGNSGHFFT